MVVASTSDHLINFHLPYINELKKTCDVYVMAKDVSSPFADYNIKFEKKIFSLKHFKIINQIKKILRKENFDIIYLNTSLASFLVRFALKGMKNRPVIVNIVHGYLFSKHSNPLKNKLFKWAEKLVKKQTDYIVTMNEEDFDIASKNKLCLKKVYKINGMGIDGSRVTEKHKPINHSNEPQFVYIGELSNRKNQSFLIRCISHLDSCGIKAHLTLVGGGIKKQKLARQIKNNKLEDQVELVGYDRDIDKYLSSCDYYVCSSNIEGMPFNILEAMYNGCVVLSSNIKGSSDLIENGTNGVLFELDDLQDFTDKFMAIKDNIPLQEKMSKNAQKTATDYLITSVFDENYKLFTSFIKK